MQDECRTSVPAAIADPLKRLPPSAVKASPLARYAVLDLRRGERAASQCRQRPNRHDDSILPGFPVLPEEPKLN